MFPTRSSNVHFNPAPLPDECSALERAQLFARSKVLLQRTVIARELLDVAHDIGYDNFIVHMLPVIRERLLIDTSAEVRALTLDCFGGLTGFLIQGDPDEGYNLVISELIGVLHDVIIRDRETRVKLAACGALVLITPHIRSQERAYIILPIILSLAHDPETSINRAIAAQALARLTEYLGSDLCDQFVVPQICCLAEDQDNFVAAAAAAAIEGVSFVASDSIILSRLLPTFVTLAQHPDTLVREACPKSLLALTQNLKLEMRPKSLCPIIRQLLQDHESKVRLAAQRILGPFIVHLRYPRLIPHDLVMEFLGFASLEDNEIVKSSMVFPSGSFGTASATISQQLLNLKQSVKSIEMDSVLSRQSVEPMLNVTHQVSSPKAICAYHIAAVLFVISGHGDDLFAGMVLGSGRASHQEGLSEIASEPVAESADIFSDCGSCEEEEYWWTLVRPAVMTLLNSKGHNAAVEIRYPIASSLSLIATLLLQNLNITTSGLRDRRRRTIDSIESSRDSNSTNRMSKDSGTNEESASLFENKEFNLYGARQFFEESCQVHPQSEPVDNKTIIEPKSTSVKATTAPFREKQNINTNSNSELISATLEHTCSAAGEVAISSEEVPRLSAVISIPLEAGLQSTTKMKVSSGLEEKGSSSSSVIRIRKSVDLDTLSTSRCFKSKRPRGTLSNPAVLQDMEAISQMLLSDNCVCVQIALIQNLPTILRYFPNNLKGAYIEQLHVLILSTLNDPVQTRMFINTSDIAPQTVVSYDSIPTPSKISNILDTFARPSGNLSALRQFLGLNTPGNPQSGYRRPVEHIMEGPTLGRRQQCWRLRMAVAKHMEKYIELVPAEMGRELVLPLFELLATDGAAIVRKVAATATASLVVQMCPQLHLYFTCGGTVNCMLSSRSDIRLSQEQAPVIPLSANVALPNSEMLEDLLIETKTATGCEYAMKAPALLAGPEVNVIRRSSNFQNRITFIRMAEAVLLRCPKLFFQLYFLRPLVRLSADPVRNVRWAWSAILRLHVRKEGRLGNNAVIVSAACSLLSSCSQIPPPLHMDLRPSRSSQPKLKRSASTSSIDLLTSSTYSMGSPSKASSSELPTTSNHVPPEVWRQNSFFVGDDAETRRLLGSIIFASDGEMCWDDGFDLEDICPFTSESDTRPPPFPPSISTSSECNVAVPSSSSGGDKKMNFQDELNVARSTSSPSQFLIASPRNITTRADGSCGVSGLRVDELD